MNARSTAISIGLCGLLAGAPAAAVENLTGTWEGSLKCQTLNSGTTTKTKEDQTILVNDGGVEGVTLSLVSTEGVFDGFVVADGKKAVNGVLTAASCNFGGESLAGGVLRVELKTKTGDLKASLKGDLILMNEENAVTEACTLTAKRVSQAPPKFEGCPAI
jgi:hypothetical protein